MFDRNEKLNNYHQRITILHLRSSEGSGGGPEKTIFKTGCLIDSKQFRYIIMYLSRQGSGTSPIAESMKSSSLEYFDLKGHRFFDLRQLVHISRFMNKYQVNILHTHDPKTDVFGALLILFHRNVKFVSTIHGWIRRSRKSALYNKLDIFALRFFDMVIAVSSAMQDEIRRKGIRNTALVHNAVDTDEWRPQTHFSDVSAFDGIPLTKDAFTIGFIGRLSKEKGPLVFVRVAQAVLLREQNCEFVVCGEGPESDNMKSLAAGLGIADHFHFLGQVKNSEMPLIYGKLNVLLSTSFTEGLPNNILEACAMCVPVVATNVGGVSEIISDGYSGLLSAPGDIDSLTSHVIAIKRDKKLADTLSANSRQIVTDKFSFSARVKKIEAIYRNITEPTGALLCK